MYELSKELGRPVAALENRPELLVHLKPIWEAFNWLSSSRQLGFGVGPIPFGAVVEYMAFEGITNRDKQWRWLRLIQSLDFTWLDLQRDDPK